MIQTHPLFRASLPLLLAASVGTAAAAISIPSTAGVTVNFAAAPLSADWSSVSVAGGATDLLILGNAATGIDVATTGVSDSLAWPGTATNWATNTLTSTPAAQNLLGAVRYVTGSGNIFTGPTGNRYSALIGRFTNNAGGAIESFKLGWNLGIPFAPGGTGAVGTDPLAGLHVYFSKTGTTGSWTLVSPANGTAGAVGPHTITVPSNLSLGSDIFIAWVDDNGPGGATAPNLEGNFTIDDVAITNVTLASASVSAAVSAVTRDNNLTPADPTDDKINFTLTVTGSGAVSADWKITAAPLTTANTAYGVKHFTGVAIANFSGPGHTLTSSVEDSVNASINAPFTVTAPWGTIVPAATNFVYNDNLTPTDATDDTASYDLSATGTFTAADYTRDTVPASAATVVGYGVPSTISLPAAPTGPSVLAAYSFTDNVDATLTAALGISPPSIIGTSTVSGSPVNILSLGNAGNNTWTFDGAARTMQMADGDRGGAGVTAKTVTSANVSLAGVSGVVQFSMDMTATDGSSGFEGGDTFVAELIMNDGVSDLPAVNLITPFDTNANGVLAGGEIVGANAVRTINMVHFIPDNIQSARVVIRGICDSAATSEKMDVSNLLFSIAPPALTATAGTVTFDNHNTVDPLDDTISAPVTVTPVNLGGSTGWTSTGNPASGLYAASPTTFTALASASPATVTVSNTSPAVSAAPFTLTRPAATLTATLVAGSIVRNLDGTVSFQANIASTNAGPSFTAATPLILEEANLTTVTGATTYSGSPVTLTLHNPPSSGTVTVTIADASYPTAPAPVNITVAVPVTPSFVIGKKNLGAGLQNVNSTGTPAVEWLNYPAQVSMVMTAGGATDKVVETETVDLSTVAAVNFTAKFRAHETSTGSNFETGDRFKAELVYTVGGTPTTVNLVGTYDTGAGGPSTTGTGLVGAPDGFINGYQGAAGTQVAPPNTVYAAPIDDYNDNRARDEFNAGLDAGATKISNIFNLAAVIPANADDVKLVLTGAGVAGSEGFVVSDVLFALSGPVDTDSDGMDDAYEDANGLDKNNAGDKFLDRDSDGSNNFAEFLAGTGANNPLSKLDFTVTSFDGNTGAFSLTWTSVPGKNYRIQGSTTMQPGTWTDLTPSNIPAEAGDTTSLSGTFPGPVPPRLFFDVRVAP